MRLESNRDVDMGDVRPRRRRLYQPESHDYHVDDDVAPYSLPHRARREEVQRPAVRPPKSHLGISSSRSNDASYAANMPPPPPFALPQSSAEAYRRPKDTLIYAHDQYPPTEYPPEKTWRRGRRDRSPEYEHPPPRAAAAAARDYRPPSPISQSDTDSLGGGEIEVVEDVDEEDHRSYHGRRRRRRLQPQSSHDDYMESSDDIKQNRRRVVRRRSLDDNEIEVEVGQSSQERDSRYHRSPMRYESSDDPRKGRKQRVSSIIETSRPPLSSPRLVEGLVSPRMQITGPSRVTTKVYESMELVRDSRPRLPSTVREGGKSRSVSRHPRSVQGSMYAASTRQPSRSPSRAPRPFECIECGTEAPSSKSTKLKCGHRMCPNCLKRVFKVSIKNPSKMPPSCCDEHIPLRYVEQLFDAPFKKTWNAKYAEYSSRSRIYCPNRNCGEWIKPASITREGNRKIARCSRCKTRVCATCSNKWHNAMQCPSDESMELYLEQAKEDGWKQCYRCKNLVEHKETSSHVICQCNAEFCMTCGSKWKTCDCPWFPSDGLDSDGVDDMDVPIPPFRDDQDSFRDTRPPSPGGLPAPAKLPHARSRPHAYDDDTVVHQIQQQKQREDAMRRRVSRREGVEGFRARGGVSDVGIGTTGGFYATENYKRGGRKYAGPPPSEPPIFGGRQASGDHRYGGSKAGARGNSMERRLEDRFSRNRQAPAPPMSPPMHAPPMSPTMGSPIMPPPMGMPPPPMGPPLGADRMYSMGGMRGPRERGVMVEDDPDDYDDEDVYLERWGSRRRRRQPPREEPKSSTLAGLSGHGQGMGRVDGWRMFVEPGIPEVEGSMTLAAAR